MKRENPKMIVKEFEEFLKPELNQEAGVDESKKMFRAVVDRLFPNPWVVFFKIAAVHGIVGFLSLAICNQFGLNPFERTHSLADFFMSAGGHHFCMFACGVFFVATTYVLANLVLSLEEIEALRRHEWLQTGVLSLLSLAGFYLGGAELVGGLVSLWLLGAFLGGIVSLEGSYRLRLRRI